MKKIPSGAQWNNSSFISDVQVLLSNIKEEGLKAGGKLKGWNGEK